MIATKDFKKLGLRRAEVKDCVGWRSCKIEPLQVKVLSTNKERRRSYHHEGVEEM